MLFHQFPALFTARLIVIQRQQVTDDLTENASVSFSFSLILPQWNVTHSPAFRNKP